jgi:hypothetical protein
MQDVGGKEDTRVEHKDLTLARDGYMSNPLDTVSPLETCVVGLRLGGDSSPKTRVPDTGT